MNMHINTLFPRCYKVLLNSMQRCTKSCANKLFITIFNIWSKFNVCSWNWNFLVACTFTHCVLKACKISLISINGLRGVALTKKKKQQQQNPNKQTTRTDWRTDGSKHFTLRNFVAWDIIRRTCRNGDNFFFFKPLI